MPLPVLLGRLELVQTLHRLYIDQVLRCRRHIGDLASCAAGAWTEPRASVGRQRLGSLHLGEHRAGQVAEDERRALHLEPERGERASRRSSVLEMSRRRMGPLAAAGVLVVTTWVTNRYRGAPFAVVDGTFVLRFLSF